MGPKDKETPRHIYYLKIILKTKMLHSEVTDVGP